MGGFMGGFMGRGEKENIWGFYGEGVFMGAHGKK